MNVGYNVRMQRMSKGMSQDDLAEAVGVSKSMIYQVERGTKNLTIELANEIANVLECKINDFVK